MYNAINTTIATNVTSVIKGHENNIKNQSIIICC